MGLKEYIKKDIDNLKTDELIIISEHIRFLKKVRLSPNEARSVEETRQMTATSKSNWAEDVIKER